MSPEGDRTIVALPPGMEVPPIEAKADPIQRAIGRLSMLRVALQAYYGGALDGATEYPRAATIDQLAVILERLDLLPEDWNPGGPTIDFELARYRYRIVVSAAGQPIAIESPPAKNPYRMLLVLPHMP